MELKSFNDQTHQIISETPEPLPRLALVIRQYLQEHQIAYTEQQSDEQDPCIFIWCRTQSVSCRLYFDMDETKRTLMVTTYLPVLASKPYRTKLTELLALINDDIYLGRFSIEMSTGEISFKNSLSIADGVLTMSMVDGFLSVASCEIQYYFHAFMLVIYGGKTATQALEQLDEIFQQSTDDDEENMVTTLFSASNFRLN